MVAEDREQLFDAAAAFIKGKADSMDHKRIISLLFRNRYASKTDHRKFMSLPKVDRAPYLKELLFNATETELELELLTSEEPRPIRIEFEHKVPTYPLRQLPHDTGSYSNDYAHYMKPSWVPTYENKFEALYTKTIRILEELNIQRARSLSVEIQKLSDSEKEQSDSIELIKQIITGRFLNLLVEPNDESQK